MSGTEIKILEKGLDYAPIQNKVNEPELRQDFDEFSRKMRTFEMKHLNVLVKPLLSDVSCLGNLHKEILVWNYFYVKLRESFSRYLKNVHVILIFQKEEWECMRSLANDRSIFIKKWIRAHV